MLCEQCGKRWLALAAGRWNGERHMSVAGSLAGSLRVRMNGRCRTGPHIDDTNAAERFGSELRSERVSRDQTTASATDRLVRLCCVMRWSMKSAKRF